MTCQSSARQNAEYRAQRTMLQLLCAVSVWRTITTRVLPLCGASAWWTALLCLLPGLLTAALFRFAMYLTATQTLQDAMRAALGKAGILLLSVILAVLLAADAAASVTSLITLFTQGVGSRGTPLTLAALTGGALLFSLHREGLARGVYLLRWVLAGAAALLAIVLLTEVRLDLLFPLYGEGQSAVMTAIEAGFSLAWPSVLLLTAVPPHQQGHLSGIVIPLFLPVLAVLLLTLSIPHGLLIRLDGLAQMLLLSSRYMSNALRVLWLCLLMLTFFFAIGAAVQLLTMHLTAGLNRTPGWLPYTLLAGVFLTQAAEPSALWTLLGRIGPWLVLPLLLLALLVWPVALWRRRCP